MTSSISGWERVAMALQDVRDRLLRCSAVLKAARIPYAIAGGNAVAEWVGRVDRAAVRFTQDVDVLLCRKDLPRAIEVMRTAGFIYQESLGVSSFLDGPDASPRDAVYLVFSGEKVKDTDALPVPEVTDSEPAEHFQIVSLDALVRMKLTAFCRKDQVHLLDLLSVGLIDVSWIARLPETLSQRLRELIENPE